MKPTRMLLLALAIVAAFAMATNTASAQYRGYGSGSGYGYGQRYGGSHSGYRVPYFSVHPPVYYGERVRLTYGDSPFVNQLSRRRGIVSASQRTAHDSVQPQMIYNRHMNSQKPAIPSTSRVPQIIYNPFFKKEEAAGSEYIAKE
ncbi:MAG: hypothetical protein ACI9G1_003564 [Pirellulaceae bacterium]|jgi:hypothetical protein